MHFLPERHWDINTPLLDLRKKLKLFWTALECWLHTVNILSKRKGIDKLDAIGLKSGYESCLLGFCKLAARYYIYACRLKGNTPRIPFFLNQIKYYASIEREVLSIKDFQEKWKPLLSALLIWTILLPWSKIISCRVQTLEVHTLIITI